jgi:hypothetical protein
MPVAERDGGGFSDNQQVEQMIGAGQNRRFRRTRIGRNCLSKTVHQDETTQAEEACQGRDDTLHGNPY